MNPVKIDMAAMPKIEVKVLCSTILEAVEAFYKDPKNLAAFEAWRNARQEQAGRGPAVTDLERATHAEIAYREKKGASA